MRLRTYLSDKPPLFTLLFGIGLLALIGLIDYATGPDLGTSIFYLAPILLVTRRSGRAAGLAMSVLATATWLWADLATVRQYSVAFIHYWNAAIRFGFFALILFLLDRLRREQLTARRDVLTGVGNRQILEEALASEIGRAQRFRHSLSCALIDVDHFKAINDSLGHQAGDEVLRATADRLLRHTRSVDAVIRFGGDEFVLLFPETGAMAAGAVVRRLQDGLAGLAASKAGQPTVTFSIGVVTFERPPQDADEVLRRADAALYAAKRKGGSTFEHEIVE